MTRILAIVIGLLTLAACDTNGSYGSSSSSNYERGAEGGGSGGY